MEIFQVSDSCSDEWTECSSRSEFSSESDSREFINFEEIINVVDTNFEILQNRAQMLQKVMENLRQELDEEVILLKRDQGEYKNLLEQKSSRLLQDFLEASAAAKAASEAYAMEMKQAKSTTMADTGCSRTFVPFVQEQENFLVNDFGRRLDQVDRLCTDEIGKIQDCTNSLRPLSQMVSRWSFENEDIDHNYQMIYNPTEIAGN